MDKHAQEDQIDSIASVISRLGDIDDELVQELENAQELELDADTIEKLKTQQKKLVSIYWNLTSLVEDLRVITEDRHTDK